MMLHQDKEYLLAVRDSLRRNIKYHQNTLNKLKKSKSKKRFDAQQVIKHQAALEASQEALVKTVHALDDLKPSEFV